MKKVLLTFSIIALILACSSNDNNEGGDNYNRTALLENWADNIIIPAFENYQAKANALVTNASDFATEPNQAKLEALRASWLEAYLAYQAVGMYNFGKSGDIKFKETANTFPADAAGIDSNISDDAPYNLSLFSQFSRQGFPGLDYMINGLDADDTAILKYYTTNAKATKYKIYLTDLTARLKTNADAVVNDWTGSYRDEYVQNNGTSINSSISKTINNFVEYFEKDLRSGKVGYPAGLFSDGVKFPEKVEGFYKNNVSKALLLEAVKASRDFFSGKHFGSATTGESLKSYLDYLNAVRDGQKLSTTIADQFTSAITAGEILQDSFSEQITADNSKMIAVYDVLQQNLVYIKLDMMQALKITIDYVDSDGD